MIYVTKLNGKRFHLNALLIETVEEIPETLVTLTNGKKYIVRESPAEVIRETGNFLRGIGLVAAQGSADDPLSGGATS